MSELYNISRYKLTKYIREKGIKIKRHNLADVDYKLNEKYFDKIDTEEKAYWLGFIYADGCINISGNSPRLSIELERLDFNHLKKFRNNIESNHVITRRKNKERDTCTISMNSRHLANKLISIGCMNNKTVNGYIDQDNILNQFYYKVAFIRGYFDGNGYVEKDERKYRLVFTLQSEQLVTSLNSILHEMGIHTRIQHNHKYYRIHIERKNDFYKFLSLIYSNAKVYLDRKYNTYLNRINANIIEIDELPNMYEPKDHILG